MTANDNRFKATSVHVFQDEDGSWTCLELDQRHGKSLATRHPSLRDAIAWLIQSYLTE